ncbi:PQQ-dependent sugar dehydrogenase [Cerasicoccus fimbriatus]|uniref:PQQ-dependent sugar dehydrogenase n=1 Tax=Cerasicoccus fimbriatus TaxID=3014554 RepID=UPI0022B41701|nr:PQQ-dependent sugar dehydrogenase [Cerasicoccus sp. TK19100]
MLSSTSISANIQQADTDLPFDNVSAYSLENAFPGLSFSDPITITTVPGESDRVFIGEKGGMLWVIPDLNAPVLEKQQFLSLKYIQNAWESGLLGVAFHPDFASNGYFYVYYTPHEFIDGVRIRYNRLSRFQVSADDPNVADPTSELILINQLDKDIFHNAGDVHFGSDGYLYFTNGDGGDANDSYDVAQRLDLDYFAGLFRIDVDRLPGNLEPNSHPSVVLNPETGKANYAIPADNPWVGATSFNGSPVNAEEVIMEYFAIGLRNPFRFWIDDTSGNIWIGDVGQYAQEEVDISRGGENFGWAYREGLIDGFKSDQQPEGFVETPPIHVYPRNEGRAIIGGLVYREDFYPELAGAYVFGDYVSGRIWALRYNGESVSRELLTQQTSLTEFDLHPQTGEILVSIRDSGEIMKLVRNDELAALPETLSETGAFTSLQDMTPAAGVIPYEPNVSFWSDHAIKQRWFALSGEEPFDYSLDEGWTAPTGAIWAKHFELELERGNPDSRKRIETRFLVKTEAGAYGVSYQWNEAGTEATLASADGVDIALDIVDEHGFEKTQTWRIPSRSECMQCHSAVSGFALSFNARQLNRSDEFAGQYQNVLAGLTAMGYLAGGPDSEEVKYIPAFATKTDESQSLEFRARSYLAVNCAQCHQPGGAAISDIDLRPHRSLRGTGMINALPGNDAGGNGDPDNRVIVPGDPDHSVLLQRLCACNGFTRMPPLATFEIDDEGVALIRDWILSLAGYESYHEWIENYFSLTAPESAADVDADGDGFSNEFEHLAGTNPNRFADAWQPTFQMDGDQLQLQYQTVRNLPLLIEASNDLVDWQLWEQGPQSLLSTEGGATMVHDLELESPLFLRFVFPGIPDSTED